MTLVTIAGPSVNQGPTADSYPKDMPTEWSVFKIGEGYWRGGPLLVEDGQNVPTRRWVSYGDATSGSERVALWDGMIYPLSCEDDVC